MPELSIVMPCLNEKLTLETCIVKAKGFLERSGIQGEIIVGDNGSTDGSQEIASRNGARVIEIKERGYGAALRGAISASQGTYVIMGDSDESYDFSSLDGFIEKLRQGYELVMGNRFRGGIKPGAMPWKNRWIGNPILSAMGKIFFRVPCSDFHCGLRGFSKSAFEKMKLNSSGMEFATEMVARAGILGLKITEVPTVLHPDGRDRPPHLRPWRDGWRHLRFMLLASPDYLFFFPSIILLLLGSLAMIACFIQALSLFEWLPLAFGPNTMAIASMLVYIGFHTLGFWILARLYAKSSHFIPETPAVSRFLEVFRLEWGIAAAGLLFLSAMLSAAIVIFEWSKRNFGEFLSPIHNIMAIYSGFAAGMSVALVYTCFLIAFFLSHRPRAN